MPCNHAPRFRLPDGCELKILEKLREAQRAAAQGATSSDGRDNSKGSGLLQLFASEVCGTAAGGYSTHVPCVRVACTACTCRMHCVRTPRVTRVSQKAGRSERDRLSAEAGKLSFITAFYATCCVPLQIDDSLTWEFIPWLRTVTSLPVLVKGILAGMNSAKTNAKPHGVQRYWPPLP